MAWAKTVCMVLCVGVAVSVPIMESQGNLQVESKDSFKCSPPQKTYPLCPDNSAICKCPEGYYGSLVLDEETKKWSGVCEACPSGFWSHIGSTTQASCFKVPCPEHASDHPTCSCNPQTQGLVRWLACSGKYDGECVPIIDPVGPPPVTTIYGGPHGEVQYSSVSFFFSSASPNDTLTCYLDDIPTQCTSPSQSYEKLSQGPHTFSVKAIDRHGQQEVVPPIVEFNVNVPCPNNSQTVGAPSFTCVCDPSFYSTTNRVFPYLNGGYQGRCAACEACPPGFFRMGCNSISAGTCEPCPAGTYKPSGTEGKWDTTCSACESCGLGLHRASCGGSSFGMCLACPAGTYKNFTGSWNTTCDQCLSCEAGKFRDDCGGTREGQCADCASETYKEIEGEWDTVCQPCKGCAPGSERKNCTSISQGTCSTCPTHSYNTQGENDRWDAPCVPCEPCAISAGGYRARCGGPQGPGTCEICSECVGAPFDQCFCDVVS